MKKMVKKLRSRFTRDQAGQSIVLLAIAFIALGAFIGLVTDISVLFVRYSTLSRTIDSAAIAAAGQIREGTEYGTVSLTAKQFIQMHGLEPSRVWVETCETDILAWRTGTGIFEGESPHPEPESLDNMPNTELCNWESPRKLVRVRAQIDSETFFLRLIGIETITLEATALSETAVIDVALVLDTSQSMALETDVSMYNSRLPGTYDWSNRPECWNNNGTTPGVSGTEDADAYQYGPCCNDPGNGVIEQQADGTWLVVPNGSFSSTPDGNFTDLICHPFRDVKDAARNFVKRLDYVRGDRVAIVTFDSEADIVTPNVVGWDESVVMLTDESLALDTLNAGVGVNPQTAAKQNFIEYAGDCRPFQWANQDWYSDLQLDDDIDGDDLVDGVNELPDGSFRRPFSYQAVAPCPDTNIGGGIRAGASALTNAVTIRNDAVWVIILLTDGAANRTDPVSTVTEPQYGSYGFCPWYTFCDDVVLDNNGNPVNVPFTELGYPECNLSINQGFELPYCNDNNPNTRHDCLVWTNDPLTNGQLDDTNPNCAPIAPGYGNERYDADDYARDWADFAGLINIEEDVPGNFIAMFTVAFGEGLTDTERRTAAPLLRYIADVGDNGFLDDDLEQDLRDDGAINGSVPANELGDPGPCATASAETEDCGQYYYAEDLDDLERVFESIASRLFTRLSR